jgi:nucleoside-diphosphate-sugar epimerase
MQGKVLITGIEGFTGAYLEQHLQQKGWDVYGTVIAKPKQANHYQCDITNKEQVCQVVANIEPAFVIHTAAISFVGETNASLIYDVNVIGTENILEALVSQKVQVQKVILASSAAVYGNQGEEVLSEDMCPKPVNHYGISKLAMEHMAATYFNKLPIIIARPFNYTGVGQKEHFLAPKIVKHFREGKRSIQLGNLHVSREFNSIHYACEVYERLLLTDCVHCVVNLASGRGVPLLDIIEMMQNIAGYKIMVEVNPAFVRRDEIKSLTGSTDLLSQCIGSLSQETLQETLQSMYA